VRVPASSSCVRPPASYAKLSVETESGRGVSFSTVSVCLSAPMQPTPFEKMRTVGLSLPPAAANKPSLENATLSAECPVTSVTGSKGLPSTAGCSKKETPRPDPGPLRFSNPGEWRGESGRSEAVTLGPNAGDGGAGLLSARPEPSSVESLSSWTSSLARGNDESAVAAPGLLASLDTARAAAVADSGLARCGTCPRGRGR